MARSRNRAIRFLTSDVRRLACLLGRHHWQYFGRIRVCPYCHTEQHHMKVADGGESVWFEPPARHPTNGS